MKIRFSVLLASLLILLLLVPPLRHHPYGEALLLGSFWVVLAAGIWAVSERGWFRNLTIALALAAFAVDVAAHLLPSIAYAAWARGLYAAFLTLLCVSILLHILSEERVSGDTLLGGISVYLLIGIAFSQLFALLEIVAPGSFVQGGTQLAIPTEDSGSIQRFPELIYYSFVTLTTLGYGDIVPGREFSRVLAALEAIIGQLYVAILIAGLVGMHLVHRRQEGE